MNENERRNEQEEPVSARPCEGCGITMCHPDDCCANCHDWNIYGRQTCDDPGSQYWGERTEPGFKCDRYSS